MVKFYYLKGLLKCNKAKNGIILYFIITVFLSLKSCKTRTANLFNDKTYVRLVNNSKYNLTEVVLFSLSFNDLGIGKKSKYKGLRFDKNKDDPMLYVTAEKKRFAIYASVDSIKGYYTYIIDSINVDGRYLYTRKIKN